MRPILPLLPLAVLAGCVSSRPQPAPRPAPPPPATAAPSLPAAPPQQDWRDVPLTPGRWTWLGGPGRVSMSQYGEPAQGAVFAMRCDLATRQIIVSLGGSLGPAAAPVMTFTTSFGSFGYQARAGGGLPPSIVATVSARDPNLDKLAFSRGRFLVDAPGQPRIVVPSWPEAARVIEDCRS